MIGQEVTIKIKDDGKVVRRVVRMDVITFENGLDAAVRRMITAASNGNRFGSKIILLDTTSNEEIELLACREVKEDPECYRRITSKMVAPWNWVSGR